MQIETSQEIGSNIKLDSNFNKKQLDLYKKMLLGVPEQEIVKELEKYKNVSPFQCAAPIKKEEIYFKCTDCSTQPTHCICESCFFSGDHEGHSFLYFNKLTGGTCDCGDPNLSQLLLCKQHQKTSQEDRTKYEHIINNQFKQLIQEYFKDKFTAVFKEFENGINNYKDNTQIVDYHVDYYIDQFQKQISQFENVLEDIKLFITDNPSGTLILSKALMEACPKFICHHDCDSIEEDSKYFMVIDKDKIEGHICKCSILKNIFRYIRFYGKKLEYEIELTLNHFFINQDFKLFLIEIFSEMFNFMQFNYSEDSKLYRLFYQFNSVSCQERFLQHTFKRGFLFKSFKQIQVYKEPTDYKKGQQKALFYYFLLYFFSTNEQNPIVWKDNFDCPIEIIKSICSYGKANNFGAHFIMTRLIQDYLYLQVVQEIFKSLQEMSLEQRMKCYGLTLVAMIDLIQEAQENEKLFVQNMVLYEKCENLEDEIQKIATEKIKFINIQEFEKIQNSSFQGLDNLKLNQINQYYLGLEQLKQYLENTSEFKTKLNMSKQRTSGGDQVCVEEEEGKNNETNRDQQSMRESENLLEDQDDAQMIDDEDDDDNIDNINFQSQLFYQSNNLNNLFHNFAKQQPIQSIFAMIVESQNNQRNLVINQFTKKIQWYEKNKCPLFNNLYRVIGTIFAQIYIQTDTIEQAKQKILDLVKTYGNFHHQQIFEKALLFVVNQLSHTLDYVRHHDENIVGYNDYQAIINGLPGNNADKVPIEKYYMNPDYSLYDCDILTLQAILPIVNTDQYLKYMQLGMSIKSDNYFLVYDHKVGPFKQNSLHSVLKNISEQSINRQEQLLIKRVKNLMKVLMMIGFDTNCQLNGLHSYKDIFVKWMKPYLKNALNICFNFSKKLTFQTLKDQLVNLKMHKQIPVKHSILNVARLQGDYFERLPNLKFVFEPFHFLRDKKLHNDYYQLLKEQYANNTEIDFVLGNQFETLITESEFAKEIFDKLCSSDLLLSLTYKILSVIDEIRYQRMYQELVQYSLKFLYCYLYINKTNHSQESKDRIKHLVLDSNLIKNLQILKEEKELYKTIEKIELLLKDLRKQIQIGQDGQIANDDIEFFNSNAMKEEEDDRTIFRKRAKEAQQRQLEIIKQKSERFKEQNKNEVGHEAFQEVNQEKHICMYCQDPQSKELQIIQAFIEKDNLDAFSNKQFKIPNSEKYRYIIQSCQHTSHYECRDKAKLTQKYKLGAIAPSYPVETRRQLEGFCMQCRFLFNIGIPFVEQYLRKSLKINNLEVQNDFHHINCDQQKIESLRQKFSKQIELGHTMKEQSESNVEKSLLLFLNSLYLNFGVEDDFMKLKITIECLVFSLQQVFEQGMHLFFKKTKLINSNLYLSAKFILHRILGKQNVEQCKQNLNEIIDFNWALLTSQQKFTEKFFSIQSYQKNYCFQELSDMYVQTCICIAISERDDIQAAIKINILSQIVFYNVVSINSRILALKSFTQTEIEHSETFNGQDSEQKQVNQMLLSQDAGFKSKNVQNQEILKMQSQEKQQPENENCEEKLQNQLNLVKSYLMNEEYMSSLMGYILPWSNLISSTLITIYQIDGDQQLEEFILVENSIVDADSQIYTLQCNMFDFLKIKEEMLISGITAVDQFLQTQSHLSINSQQLQQQQIKISLLQNIQFYEAIKFNFTDFGNNYKENHQKYISKRCSLCKSFPHATKSDLCICLICGQQMCSITCEQKNIYANDYMIKTHIGNLNQHAVNHHQGKTIFFNLLENLLILIDSPMIIEYDHLFFDVIKQPMKIDIMDYTSSKVWNEYTLDKQKLKSYQNMIVQRQIPNRIRSIIQSSSVQIECKHNFL